jgi:hypothetical protein
VSIKTRARASDAVCSSAEAGWLKVARGEPTPLTPRRARASPMRSVVSG